jgi:hypothetical protein
MSGELEVLLAKQAITEVLHRYCRAVDRIDDELGAQIWHEDGLAHYEDIFEGTGSGFIEFVFAQHRACDATSHQLANVTIDVDADLGRASSESYVTACIRAFGNDVVVRGRYRDTWSRRAGEWRIDERRFTTDILQVQPVGDQTVAPVEPTS